jgi:SAM-dependent methyltransferase
MSTPSPPDTATTPDALRRVVREKYAEIATGGGASGTTSCCAPGSCGCGGDGTEGVPVTMAEDYATLPGYVPDADLGLGCGLPTEHAGIAPGATVLDLGSGAGNDAFVARALVGEAGRVIGVDMTPEMVALARRNAERLGYANVEFRLGEIEALPVDRDSVDVVVSNCVLNLVPEKERAFAETYRVLRPGGHFCVSDIVTRGELPESARRVAELYAGCVSGAVDEAAYLEGLRAAGFEGVRVVKAREIAIPDEALAPYLAPDEIARLRAAGTAVVSVTVIGTKPGGAVASAEPSAEAAEPAGACCGPDCCGA